MTNENESIIDASAFNSLQSEFFDYAARHGLALFPIPFGFKEDLGWKEENRKADPNLRPIVYRWSQDWSKDRAQWLKWSEEYGCNFGVYAAASRCIELDIDVAKDREIWNKYCEFWKSRGLTPPSPQFMSARNGWHVLVKVPEGFDLGSLKQSELIPNVDTRIEGYIVSATSYYDGTPKGEESGWYKMVAGAPPPHDDPAVFQVLAEALKIKSKSVADVDLSLLPSIDEVAARIRHAYNIGPVRQEGDSWIKDPAAHAGNTNADDRARREANGYFANYAEWMPVVGAVSMLYGESAKAKVASVMRRGRDHSSDMFGSAWSGVPTTDIAYASLLRFIKASNQLGFSDGGRFAKAKSKETWKAGLRAAGIETVDSDDAPIAPEAAQAQEMPKPKTEQSRTPKPLPFIRFGDDRKGKYPKEIIKGWIVEGHTHSVYSPPKTGKSTGLTDMCRHVADVNMTHWRGLKIKKHCGVLYFAFERYMNVLASLDAYKVRDSVKDLPIFVVNKLIDVVNPDCVDEVMDTIEAIEKESGLPIGIVIFDTWNKAVAFGGGDEDKAQWQNACSANLRRMIEKRPALHCITVGHTGKDKTKGERGSSATPGDRDVGTLMSREGDVTSFEIEYANALQEGPITAYKGEKVKIDTDEDGEPVFGWIVGRESQSAPKSKKKDDPTKLTKNEKAAYASLEKIIRKGEHREELQTVCVTFDAWLDRCFEDGHFKDVAKPRRSLGDAQTGLSNAGLVRVHNDYVTCLPPIPTPRTETVSMP
jgi:hypothetical protein